MASVRIVSGPVEVHAAPGRAAAELRQQGQVLIIVAEDTGVIEVSVESSMGAASEARFALDLLDRGDVADGAQLQRSGFDVSGASYGRDGGVPLQIEAHVSRVGDVRVAAGDWIAGPDNPFPIEGLAVVAGRHPVDLEIQVQSALRPGVWSEWCMPGQFAGTRQRAEYLAGVRLRLGGAGAGAFTIAADALFLGAPVVRRVGPQVEFIGYDPLVGLRVEVVPGAAASQAAAPGRVSKVQVFRAQ